MLAFIDESGDAGMKFGRGSSSHFCVVAAIFKDNFSSDACDRGIGFLRTELKKPANYEFHFCHCPDPIRLAFLRCVANENFDYHAFVIDKRLLSSPEFQTPDNFYEFAVKIVCDSAGDVMTAGKVVIDRNGNREFLQRLQRSLRTLKDRNGSQIVRKAAMQDSKSNNLVQLADMVCGSVARSITANDDRFRDILRNRGRERLVQIWPG